MGLTKRIFIDKDPTYEDLRRRVAAEAADHCAPFTFRIAVNRRNATGSRAHWDPFWPNALSKAAIDLNIDAVNINSGMFVRSESERDAVKKLAETIWAERGERLNQRPLPKVK